LISIDEELECFQHFVFNCSNEKEIVSDFQGYHDDKTNTLWLIDPQIQSLKKKFSLANNGETGILIIKFD
jgi:hypothetical protein